MDGDHCYKFVVVDAATAETSGSGRKNGGRDFRRRCYFLLFYAYAVWAGVVSVVEGTHFGHWTNYHFENYYQVYVDW